MRCVISALLLLIAACGGKPTDAAKPAYRMPVLAEAAAQRPLTQEVRAGGTLEPDEIVQIATRVAGVAERIAVREGQVVAEGDVLVEIEPQRFRIAVDRAALAKTAAQVEEARAALTRREELTARDSATCRRAIAPCRATARRRSAVPSPTSSSPCSWASSPPISC